MAAVVLTRPLMEDLHPLEEVTTIKCNIKVLQEGILCIIIDL
jgi:hypothetical protein